MKWSSPGRLPTTRLRSLPRVTQPIPSTSEGGFFRCSIPSATAPIASRIRPASTAATFCVRPALPPSRPRCPFGPPPKTPRLRRVGPRASSRSSTIRSRTTSARRSASPGIMSIPNEACCGPAWPTTGTSPSPRSTATSTPTTSGRSIRDIFEGIIQPDWHARDRQAIGGRRRRLWRAAEHRHLRQAGGDKFEFVMTGRHMTLRCDGNSTDHVAFGGPIFYGHAADGFNEGSRPSRQRLLAAGGGSQQGLRHARRQAAEAARWSRSCPTKATSLSAAQSVDLPGIPVTELSSDQKAELQKVLDKSDRAVSPERSRRSGRMPQGARRTRQVLRWPSTRKAISATTRFGIAGGWKARRSSGISAARRTFTCGSTWPTIRRSP